MSVNINTQKSLEQINKDALCVIKKHSGSSEIYVDYLTIENSLEPHLSLLFELLEKDSYNNEQVFDYIDSHSNLNVLFSAFDFCQYLTGTYQGLIENKEKIKSQYFKSSVAKSYIKDLLKERALAYALESTYKKANNDEDIIAYSHRRVGWKQPIYSADQDFLIGFITNFGFGRSSHFYVKLVYKQINIIPYSDWVYYRFADISELIEYSYKCGLENQYWFYAMNYVVEAYNLSLTNQEMFVDRYLINECEKLVSGLKYISENVEFRFLSGHRFNPTETTAVLSGLDLIEFRALKLSGALLLINRLSDLGSVIAIQNYISEIENLNQTFLPILSIELKKAKEEMVFLNGQLDVLHRSLLRLKSARQTIDAIDEKIVNSPVITIKACSLNVFQQLCAWKFATMKTLNNEIRTTDCEYREISNKSLSINFVIENLEKSANIIHSYFNNKIKQ